ncbi:MAG: hypothetical protein JNM26_17465 [Ideonella sp.]|nr:hypothetical protein [Ideonella sp.]
MDATKRTPPRHEGPRFTQVLVLPALGIPDRIYTPLLTALNAQPAVRASVLPLPSIQAGWRGAWRGRRSGYLAWLRSIESDLAARQRLAPEDRYILLGHSIGGHVGLLALARQMSRVDGLALIACGTPHWKAWPRQEGLKMRRGLRVIGAALGLLPWYPGDWLGFGGRQPRRLMLDWLSLARTGRFDGMSGLEHAGADLASAIGPVLAIHIEGDSLAPPEASRALLGLAPGLDIQTVSVRSEMLHKDSGARRHNLWPRDPDSVLPTLCRWMQSRAEGPGPIAAGRAAAG